MEPIRLDAGAVRLLCVPWGNLALRAAGYSRERMQWMGILVCFQLEMLFSWLDINHLTWQTRWLSISSSASIKGEPSFQHHLSMLIPLNKVAFPICVYNFIILTWVLPNLTMDLASLPYSISMDIYPSAKSMPQIMMSLHFFSRHRPPSIDTSRPMGELVALMNAPATQSSPCLFYALTIGFASRKFQ